MMQRLGKSVIRAIFVSCVFGMLIVINLSYAQDAPIPMPGDEPSIPLPGDDSAIPMPGDDSVPLPGTDDALPLPTSSAAGFGLNLDLRGYVENTTTLEYMRQAEEEIVLNAGRVRLNLSGEPDAQLDFGIGLVGTINKGATDGISLLDYMPDDVQQQIIPGTESFFGYAMDEDDLFLQEAFGTLYGDHFRLRVGRHKFYTGTGYAYNPIDLFNVKDPLDPTYETNGLDALLLTVNFPHQTELQGVVQYDDHLDSTDYLLRLKTYLHGWDLAMQYTHYLKARVDWEALNSEEALAAFSQGASFDDFTREFRWHLLAAEFSGELWEWGLYGEGGYVLVEAEEEVGTLDEAEENHERVLLGIDHTFAFQLYVMLEYLRFGQGRTDSADITLNDRMAYFYGEVLSNNQDTLFSGLSFPLTDLMEFSCYAIIGLNDGGVLLNPWLVYDVRPGLTLSLSANLPFGDEESQNGKSGPSGFARLKFHF